MPACWIGTAQPTSSVNLVAIIVASRVSVVVLSRYTYCGAAAPDLSTVASGEADRLVGVLARMKAAAQPDDLTVTTSPNFVSTVMG
jgi:hypothetical protein